MDLLLIGIFFCPLVLLALFVGGLAWLVDRRRAPQTPATPALVPAATAPAAGDLAQFVAFDQLVLAWAKAGRLDATTAERVRDLIAEEVAAIAADREQPPVPAPAPVAAAEPPPPVAPQASPPILAAASDTPAAPAVPAMPAAPESPAAPDVPVGGEAASRRLARPSLAAALLSLGTRRTLLFLGSFLLLMSSLTLVIFSWASLPPVVQFAILAGTAGALWAGGAWMGRRPDLATAGANLQAVGALLMPVVGFALGRPGLLDLAARPAWQLASAVSLAAYLLAAWRTRRPFYSGAAALASASLLLSSLGALTAAWQLPPLAALMAAMLPIAGALRRSATPRLAEGPRWVALLGGPVTVMAAAPLYVAGGDGYPFAATLAAGALFCGLAYRLEGRAPWLWGAVALPALALEVALVAAGATPGAHALAIGALALVYLALSALAEDRHEPAARPLFVGAAALGLYGVSLASLARSEVARVALPPLIALGAGAAALVERGRLRWFGPNGPTLAVGGLFSAGALGFWWLAALLEATALSVGARGLVLLPVAAGFFAAARWWPGRLRRGYDIALQILGVSAALLAWGPTAINGETRLAGALLVGAIFGGQALVRRRWPWAALSLSFVALGAGFAVERFVATAWQLRAATLVCLGLAAVYSLGGERVRRSGWRYWTWPAVALGALAGLLAGALALIQLPVEIELFCGVLLALAALLGVHTALWRRDWLGYAAAPLLVVAIMAAAGEGFFTGWLPAPGDLAYIVCAVVLGLALLGQGLRLFGRLYARPYELTAFALLPMAPLFAGGDQAHLALTWGAMAALYGAALWRYRQPWMLALAYVALDWALLHGTAWLLPGGERADAGLVLGLAVVAQAFFSAWARRRGATLGAASLWGYLSAGIGAGGALMLAFGGAGHAAAVAGLFAVTLVALAWLEAREELAWGALAMLALALSQLHRLLGLPAEWTLLAGSLEALAIYVGGWGVQALAGRAPRLALWHRPLAYGAGAAMVALPLALVTTGVLAGLSWVGFMLAGLGAALLGWRERQAALAGVAAALWALALAVEGPARNPAAWASVGPQLLLALAWALGVTATARRLATGGLRTAAPAGPLQLSLYGAAGLAGLLAVWVARTSDAPLGALTLGLAALVAFAATVERREMVAWGALGLALAGAWLWHTEAGQAPVWAAAWMVLELVGVSLAGWAAALLGLGAWRRPTTHGAAGAGAMLTAVVGGLALGMVLPPFTFALASLGLLLATAAARERSLYYVYAAGAAFVGAALCQLADWGFSNPQWYVVPAGLYLLALAWGLRRFQGLSHASQLIETAAVVLLLGVTLGRAILGADGPASSLLLFGEALAVAAYGALARLRVPFVGGVAFFVAGVIWMTLDSVRLVNQWVLLGAVGLLMVLAYVVLERHQERLARAGRRWVAQLQSWG